MKVNISKYYKNCKPRKAEVKLIPSDTWNMDHTLSLIILPMLKQLKETKGGAPNVFDDDVPEEIRFTAAKPCDKWDNDEFHFKRWDYVMNEMIWTFEQLIKDDGLPDEFFKNGLDKEGYSKYKERIDNGTRLFGVYFRSLYD